MSASGGTSDINKIRQSAEFKELLERLWSKWEGKKITRNPRNRKTSKRSFADFLAGVIAAAYRAGIQDPLKNIDWEHVLDPDLSQAKNLSLLERRYGIRAEDVSGRRRKKQTPPGGTEEGMLMFQIAFLESEIADLDFMIAHGEDKHGNRLTPEQVEDAKRRKAKLEGQLEELRRRLERLKRGRITAWLPREAPRPAPSVRPAEGRAPRPAPQPTPPPAPQPAPGEERQRLWELFSMTLAAAGIDPTQYREDFEAEYRRVSDRPYEDKLGDIMRFVNEIVRTYRPRPAQPAVAPAELQQALRQMEENLRKGLESIVKSLNRPIRPQKYMTAAEAELAYVPPEKSIKMIPVEDVKLTPEQCGGHRHVWVPNSDALGLMRGYGVHPAIIRKFYTCPEMWWGEADGSTDLEYTVEVMKEVGEVPRFFARWLMKLAKAIDDRYEKEGRLKDITRLKELRKRYKGPLTSAGR
ncbi:MAG: hypothetical protein RXQ79_04140 [Acidilobus sp.]